MTMTLDQRMASLEFAIAMAHDWSVRLSIIRTHMQKAIDEAVTVQKEHYDSIIEKVNKLETKLAASPIKTTMKMIKGVVFQSNSQIPTDPDGVCRHIHFVDCELPIKGTEFIECRFEDSRFREESELAAFHMTTEKVTTGEASGVINAHLQATPGDCLSETAKAIDALIAPRVAQAVEAEQERHAADHEEMQTKIDKGFCQYESIIKTAKERHAADMTRLGDVVQDMREVRERHTAEMAAIRAPITKVTPQEAKTFHEAVSKTVDYVQLADLLDHFIALRMMQAIAVQREKTKPVTPKECNCGCHISPMLHFRACCEGRCLVCGKYWNGLKEHRQVCTDASLCLAYKSDYDKCKAQLHAERERHVVELATARAEATKIHRAEIKSMVVEHAAELRKVASPASEPATTQGRCDTTQTERFENPRCTCGTYAENKGPCRTFKEGSNFRCVYCDHEPKCHPIPASEASTIADCMVGGQHINPNICKSCGADPCGFRMDICDECKQRRIQ